MFHLFQRIATKSFSRPQTQQPTRDQKSNLDYFHSAIVAVAAGSCGG